MFNRPYFALSAWAALAALSLPVSASPRAAEWKSYLQRIGFGPDHLVASLSEDLGRGSLSPSTFDDPAELKSYANGLAQRAASALEKPELIPAAELKQLTDETVGIILVARALDRELPARVPELVDPLRRAFARRLRRQSSLLEERLALFREPWIESPDDEMVFRDWLEGMRGRPSATAGSPFLAMGRLESLSRRTDLPEFVTAEVARDLVEHHASRNYADLILSSQRRLPPSALAILRSGLNSSEADTRLKTASYLLLHDPEDAAARKVIRAHIESTPQPRGWEGLLNRTLLSGHEFFFETTTSQVIAVAHRKFNEKMSTLDSLDPDRSIEAAFKRFVGRAERYTKNARRLTKTLKDAVMHRWPSFDDKKADYWDRLLLGPESARRTDMVFQRAVLDALRQTLPIAIAEENRRIEADGHSGLDRIAGALIVGSIATGHPNPDSDLDLILITENGGPAPTEAITRIANSLKNKNLPLLTVDRVIDAHGWGFNRRAGSLGVQRLIARGAIFIAAGN